MQDLNDLRFFAAVVANGGFTAAALALGVPKSRLSRRVALLEEELGVRLLERSTRRIQVTEVGREVYAHAQAVVVEADAVNDVALRVRAEPQGLVRLSCPLNLRGVIGERLPAFLDRYPRLRLQFVLTNRRVDLIEERVDVAVRIRERLDTDADLQMRHIGVTRRILVASPELLAAYPAPSIPEELTALPLLSASEQAGPSVWRLVDGQGRHAAVDIEPRLSVGDFGVLLAAALEGAGAALLPEVDARAALETGRLVRLLPDWSVADGLLHLVFTSHRSMLPGVRAVIEFAAATLADAVR